MSSTTPTLIHCADRLTGRRMAYTVGYPDGIATTAWAIEAEPGLVMLPTELQIEVGAYAESLRGTDTLYDHVLTNGAEPWEFSLSVYGGEEVVVMVQHREDSHPLVMMTSLDDWNRVAEVI